MRKYKLMLCRFPGSGSEHHGCVSWLMERLVEMYRDPAIECVDQFCVSDTPITMLRNAAVKRALAREIDYILMVDSDMVPDYLVGLDPVARPFWSTAWAWMLRRREQEEGCRERLLQDVKHGDLDAADADRILRENFPPATVAAPYCGPPPHESVFIFRWKNSETDVPDPNFRLEMIEREDAAFRAGFEQVDALPTGLILYDARLFKGLPMPWFAYEWGDDEQTIKASTEDVYQTRNASLAGFPQVVLWDSWAAHVKTKHVRKPVPYTRDKVGAELMKAAASRFESNQRLGFVTRSDGPPRQLPDRFAEERSAVRPSGLLPREDVVPSEGGDTRRFPPIIPAEAACG